MKVLDDNYMVCDECIPVIANDDYSHLDFYYREDIARKRAEEIRHAINHAGGYIAVGNSDKDEEFSTEDCDCCGNRCAGGRYHCVLLSNEKEAVK